MNIHKPCAKVVEEHCIGALRHKKDKPKERSKRDRKSYIMENIIGKTRKPSHTVPGASKPTFYFFLCYFDSYLRMCACKFLFNFLVF